MEEDKKKKKKKKKKVFILAGQSNMAGRGGVHWSHGRYQWDGVVPAACAPSPSILRLSIDLCWEEARDPLHLGIEPKTKTCGVGPGMSFANRLLLLLSRSDSTIALVPCAVGGTAIKEWEKGSNLYNRMVQRAKQAAQIGDGGDIKAVLWYQGESDTESDDASDHYAQNLNKFIEDVRLDLGLPYLPFVQVALASGTKKNLEKVRKAQLELDLPNVVCVDAMGLPLNSDHLHLTTDAQVKLGEMLADAYITHFAEQPYSTVWSNYQLKMGQNVAEKGNKYLNNWLLNLYGSKRGVMPFVVVSILLLYIIYSYCC